MNPSPRPPRSAGGTARWVDALLALPRWVKVALFAGVALLIFLWSVTAATAMRGSDEDRPTSGSPRRWCNDWSWTYQAARLYQTTFASAKRPITPVNITASLSAGGTLYVDYRDLVARGGIPEIDQDELRSYMTQLAEVEAAGMDPLVFAEDVQKACS